jgi:hypothetical protein
MKNWLKKLAKKYLGLYDISDLQIGGHCGCCGKWISDEIFEKIWAVGICKEDCLHKEKKIRK